MPDVEPDPIPTELKRRDRWLLWDASSDTPRRPHWRGDFGISWNDPDDWQSFEAALEAAQERESWGIIYVFTPEVEHFAIDIDGAFDSEGYPRDWFPGLDPFQEAGAYVERSPSGNGIHFVLEGEPPEWWRDCEVDPDLHQGVDVLTNKPCTVTGDTLDESGTEIVDVDADTWFTEVYHRIRGELPGEDRDQDDHDEPDGDLSREQVEDALSHVDPDLPHTEWVRLGYAVHDWDNGSAGRSVFESWSKGGSKWDRAAERSIDSIWQNARSGQVTVGTLVHFAKEGGWEPPWATTAPDGGTAAQASTSTNRDGGPDLVPVNVLAEAGYDPEEETVGSIANSEAAYAIASILERSDDWHFLTVDDETQAIYSYDQGVWNRDGENRLKTVTYYAASEANSKRLHSETCHAVRSNPLLKVGRDELGAPDGTVAVENGLLDLDARDLRDLEPEDFAINQLPVEYVDGADYDGTEWMEFLDDSVRDGDLPKLQEYCGYLLWHHAQPFGKALFLLGPTDSGKGTFLDVVESVVGHENVASQSLFELMQTRWGMAELYGKMANIRNEISGGGLKNVQRFKELTGGGDRVSAERKGQDPFKFQAVQKFLFATNQVPNVEHAGEPFFNRLLFVKFPDTVPEEQQDPELADRLKDQAPAILNWMLDGLDRLMDQEGFTNEGDVDDKREIADAFGNVLDRFAHNLLEITGDPKDIVHKGQLHTLFSEYAEHLDKDADSQQFFTRRLKDKAGVSDGQSSRVDDPDTDRPRVFTGVRVIEEHIAEFDGTVPNFATAEDSGDGAGQQTF